MHTHANSLMWCNTLFSVWKQGKFDFTCGICLVKPSLFSVCFDGCLFVFRVQLFSSMMCLNPHKHFISIWMKTIKQLDFICSECVLQCCGWLSGCCYVLTVGCSGCCLLTDPSQKSCRVIYIISWHEYSCGNHQLHDTRQSITSQSPRQQLVLLNSNIFALQQKSRAPLSPKILQHLLPHTPKKHTQAFLIWTERQTGKPKLLKELNILSQKHETVNVLIKYGVWEEAKASDRCSQGSGPKNTDSRSEFNTIKTALFWL